MVDEPVPAILVSCLSKSVPCLGQWVFQHTDKPSYIRRLFLGPAAATANMRVFVQGLEGATITVECDRCDTVSSVADFVAASAGVDGESIK